MKIEKKKDRRTSSNYQTMVILRKQQIMQMISDRNIQIAKRCLIKLVSHYMRTYRIMIFFNQLLR